MKGAAFFFFLREGRERMEGRCGVGSIEIGAGIC